MKKLKKYCTETTTEKYFQFLIYFISLLVLPAKLKLKKSSDVNILYLINDVNGNNSYFI